MLASIIIIILAIALCIGGIGLFLMVIMGNAMSSSSQAFEGGGFAITGIFVAALGGWLFFYGISIWP